MAHFRGAANRGCSSPYIRFQSAAGDGNVVTDGSTCFGTEGDSDSTRLVAGGVRNGARCRARNIPHLGFWSTTRTRSGRQPGENAEGETTTEDLVPQVLADELHVHVRTLRAAAHDGRLAATFGPDLFGKLTATATRESASTFMATWYHRTYGRGVRRPVAVCRVTVPASYAASLWACGAARLQSAGARRQGRRGQQGGRLPVGKRQAKALARVLVANRTAPTSAGNCGELNCGGTPRGLYLCVP